MDAHPTRLWGLAEARDVPNAQGSTATINSYGFRGDRPEASKPDGQYRILTTGDSSFYGFGVGDTEVFSHQLSASFIASGMNVEVLNTGIGGYTVAQHALLLDEFGWDLDPDLVVLANVWSDNTWDSFHDEDLIRSNRFAAANPLTKLALVKVFAAWLSEQSVAEDGKVIVWNAADGWPTGKVRRVPLKRWMDLQGQILQQASQKGIGAIFIKPTNTYLLQDEHTGPPPAWNPYFEAMDALGRHLQVPVVDMTKAFKEAMAAGATVEDLLWDKMHPTALGHQVLSDAIFDLLKAEGWPKSPLIPSSDAYAGPVIKDMPTPQWTDDAGAGSPQVKLFDLTEEQLQVMEENRQKMADNPPPELDAPNREVRTQAISEAQPGPSPPSPPISTTWQLTVEVSGGEGPYRVSILDNQGRTVSQARLKKAGQFPLRIRSDVMAVSAVLEDSNGARIQVRATPESPQARLLLGD